MQQGYRPETPDPHTETRVLVLPGWQDSGPGHWQTMWQARHACERVQQSDWMWPRRGDWMARLEEVLLDDPRPTLLVAHSLGCHLVAAWAAHSQHTARVCGALLVAPPAIERADTPPQLTTWRPVVRRRMPFPATLVYSDDDPFGDSAHALALASDWGARALGIGAAGHVNADSGLGDWPAGWAELMALIAPTAPSAPTGQMALTSRSSLTALLPGSTHGTAAP